MAIIDVSSSIATFLPVFAFLLVFAVVYGLLSKTKILGENRFVHILISFSLAVIFLASSSALQFTKVSSAWFAAFIISILFIVLIVGLARKNLEDILTPGFTWFIVIALILIFIFSGIFVFKDAINTYLAQPKNFILDPTILGVVVLVGLTVFISWLLARDKLDKKV